MTNIDRYKGQFVQCKDKKPISTKNTSDCVKQSNYRISKTNGFTWKCKGAI